MKTNDFIYPEQLFKYDPENGNIYWLDTGRVAGHVNDRGYRIIEVAGKRYKAHRIAWTIYHGQPPTGQIDHLNRIKSDNRIINLRDTDTQGNMRNRNPQTNNTSGQVGVVWHKLKKKWIARIKVNGKHKWLGEFKDKKDAIIARHIAEEVFDFV